MLGKVGYGTASEAVAHNKPFVYIRRDFFNEQPFLVKLIAQHGLAHELRRDEFYAGNWHAKLEQAYASAPPRDASGGPTPRRADCRGGEVVARVLEREARRLGGADDADTAAAVIETVPVPVETPETTPFDRVMALPEAESVTMDETSTSPTLVSPPPPKVATAATLVCWYDGPEEHALEPSIRLSVASATSTPSDTGYHTVTGTDTEPAPVVDATVTDDPVPPAVWLCVISTVQPDSAKSVAADEKQE